MGKQTETNAQRDPNNNGKQYKKTTAHARHVYYKFSCSDAVV